MRTPRLVVAATAVVLAVGACANPDYDGDDARRDLEAAGLTREQADCVTDGMEDEFDAQRLSSRSEVTEEEYATMVEILDRCDVDISPEDATPTS